MKSGAEQAGARPEGSAAEAAQAAWLGAPAEEQAAESEPIEAPRAPRSIGLKLFGALLILMALGWLGAAGWSIWLSRAEPTLPNIVTWIATLTGPLVLLALLWVMAGRTSRRETERFTRAVGAMRAESHALEAVLEIVATRIEENHARLRGEAERLMTLGDEASDRLGRVTHYLSKESGTLDRQAAALEAAAAAATFDVGVLLHDLPRAEEQARKITEAMKEAGITAHTHAGSLEAQLAALTARGREADEVLGGAAQRMSAHVARIESSSTAAATSMNEASAGMTAAVDGAMSRAAEAVDAARMGLETQSGAMLAAIEQSRAALDRAGEDAARNLSERLDTIGSKIEALAGHLAEQDAASHALVGGLSKELADLDQWFARLGETGNEQSGRLAGSVEAVRESTRALIEEVGGGSEQANHLIARAHDMAQALGAVSGELGKLPAGFASIEAYSERTQQSAAALAPIIETVQASAEFTATRVGDAEQSIARQREMMAQLLAQLDEGVTSAEKQLQRLGVAAFKAEDAAAKIAVDTGPALIEALLRVRDTATQAAERAREAIGEVIPQSVALLADQGREALGEAVRQSIEPQMAEMETLARRALDAAREASTRLTRQMLVLGETTAAVEERIDDARREREERDSENFSRRVALLIESLNSTAIDVNKILSNEVTDSTWAAYLKGDRGVFTRRAVRLLDSGEARDIAVHYDEEPEFREQVNRYIHDFEAMLRRVLADRDGSSLGITILSSDMGKLYVALAQAIDRIRT